MGKEVGAIVAFFIVLKGYTYDPDYDDLIYYGTTGVVFVIGLLTCIFLVKEPLVNRLYVKDQRGEHYLRVNLKKKDQPIDGTDSDEEAPFDERNLN